MESNYFFSKHATQRLRGRTKLNAMQLNTILRKGRCIQVHSEPGPIGDKEHMLFYSKKDGKFYIAVVSQPTKEIMTILHSWQHRSCYKKITKDQLAEAKALIPDVAKVDPDETNKELPNTFHVKVSYGADQRVSNLFKGIACDYDYDIKMFSEDRPVNIRVANELSLNGFGNTINGITIRLGSRGIPVVFDWDGNSLIPTGGK